MKGTRAISFLLVFALMASLVVPGFFAQPAKAEGTDNGMRISKTATKNTDGTYTITLEAYATGKKVISEVKTDIPTDIILVLDQSGSMEQSMNTYSFQEYTDKTNSDYYELRHNDGSGNLYYKLDDGGYATVSVVRSQVATVQKPEAYDPGTTNGQYFNNRDNLYAYDSTTNEYTQVTLERSRYYRTYTYYFPDGTKHVESGYTSYFDSPGDFGGRGPLYYMSTSVEYSYEYSYTDENSVTHQIGTSEENDATPGFTLYERISTGTTTRLAALQSAVTGFADNVAAKAKGADGQFGTEDDVNHRIAVVGFATGNYTSNSDYPTYENTELFIGSAQYNYNVNASQHYASAFQDMSTEAGYNNVIASKNALAARGATYPNYGLAMASGIFNAYPIPEKEKRNRVVVLFTDGAPGYSSFDSDVANSAITSAATLKNNSVTIYSVGIFEGANATSAGSSTGDSPDPENWFMQNVSSNNGTPRSPSYYLSASDAGTLNSIFEQIASNIESGGTTATLGSSSVVKDIIAPSFQLPEGATADSITLETYKYTGVDNWVKNADAMGAEASIEGDQVSVTGFNFTENWCGTVTENGSTTYRGNKLVISFKVVPKDGFLGGNGVYTNTSAGVYENSEATNPIMTFDRPQVNVPIRAVSVTSTDKNVYLLQNVSADTLKSGATVTVGGVSLDLSQANNNYGLADWQTAYVDISVVVKDANNTVISGDLTDLTADSTYSITVTVSPKTEGAATAQNGDGTGNIYVYKPVLTYKDSSVYYGDSVPTDFSGNLASASWQHNGAAADATTMGAAPALSFQYTPGTGVVNDTIATKQDIPVDVTVSIVSIDGKTDITEYTTFPHINCEGKTCDVPSGSEFLLHVKTCTLTITKISGDSSEPYVFSVKKGDDKYTEASITGNGSVTIYELPVGTYSIQEDTGWSWRYTPSYSDSVTLSATNPNGTITCTNTKTGDFWLNGFSAVVKNIFGIAG